MAVAVDRLTLLPLFSALASDELKAMSGLFTHRQVSAGTRLTVEGASGYTFFVIESGTVHVERAGELLSTLGAGDFFGEMSIRSGARRNATVTATTTVDLLVLVGTESRVLERDLPSVAAEITKEIARRALPAAKAS